MNPVSLLPHLVYIHQLTTLQNSTLKMEAACIAETLTPSNTTTQHNNPRTELTIHTVMINSTFLQHKFLALVLLSHKS
jgi:hypothetical protein